MSGRQYTVYEFAKLTPFQKERLKQRDPAQYEHLAKESAAQLPTDSENGAGSDVALRD